MARPSHRMLAAVLLLGSLAWNLTPGAAEPASDPVRFAVIGDFGTGSDSQYELAKTMASVHARSPYSLVIMVGDNIYGGWNRNAVVQRFETPYKALLDAGVTFFASLGNHDDPNEREYPLFNMGGQRYYRFTRSNVEFYALDSNYMDRAQLSWLEESLQSSTAAWKVAFFHHPLYSSGQRHGSEADLRALIEPLFVEYGVQVVFSGHDHVYERLKPQQGITYFVCGSSGQLRRGNLDRSSTMSAAGFDQDLAFMAVDVDGDIMRFQAISRTGTIVDSSDVRRRVIPSP